MDQINDYLETAVAPQGRNLHARLEEAEARVAELVRKNKALLDASASSERRSPMETMHDSLPTDEMGDELRTFDRVVKNNNIVIHASPREVIESMTSNYSETTIGRLRQVVLRQRSSSTYVVYWAFHHDDLHSYDLLLRLHVTSSEKKVKIRVESIAVQELEQGEKVTYQAAIDDSDRKRMYLAQVREEQGRDAS